MALTRRQLLIGTIGASASGIAGAYFGLRRSRPQLLQFDFLNRGNDGSLQEGASDLDDLVKRSLPVTPFLKGLISEEVKAWAVEYAQAKGIAETEKAYGKKVILFQVNEQVQCRYRAIPEPEIRYAAQYKAYAEFATDFLFEHADLQTLPKIPIEWLFPQNDKPEGRFVPAYIAHSYIREQKIGLEFMLQDQRKVKAEVVYPQLRSGGTMLGARWNFDPETGEFSGGNWSPAIIVSTYNQYALQAPFSEMTPLMFAEGIGKYIRRLAEKNPGPDSLARRKEIICDTHKLGETITESVSLYLLTELLLHPAMVRARQRTSALKIESAAQELASADEGLYADVPQAYEYLKRKGLRVTVGLFMDDPGLYLGKVKSI